MLLTQRMPGTEEFTGPKGVVGHLGLNGAWEREGRGLDFRTGAGFGSQTEKKSILKKSRSTRKIFDNHPSS